ncbi:hypothetical protein AB4027_09005 [Alkalibacterium putridalgicola]|uniref:hypothetical protein n=1 Tax=Alkalibacterium putridalgicola TaxID=426703 RepID=UPI0034CDD3D1
MIKDKMVQPMPFWQSLLYFGIPAAIFIISIYVIMPLLGEGGVDPVLNYTLTLMGPVILLFGASFVALKFDGYELRWKVIKRRFRLKPIKKRVALDFRIVFIYDIREFSFTTYTIVAARCCWLRSA